MKSSTGQKTLNLDKHFSFFDTCHSSEQVISNIRKLCNAFLASIRSGYIQSDTIAPDILPELLDTEPECLEDSLPYLLEICRLLLKAGDDASLNLCIHLAHRIYKFERKQKTTQFISYLHKGIAQIGLGMTEIGIKNVLSGISDKAAILPSDLCLSYRALMSAAIAHKNIKLALKFGAEWKDAAETGKLPGEMFRSRMTMQILHLVSGNTEACNQGIREMPENVPDEWKEALAMLKDWTHSLSRGICYEIQSVSEPCPLFAGVSWLRPDGSADFSKQDFAILCERRQRFCTDDSLRMFSAEELEKYAILTARWDLPKILSQIELILKQKAPERYYLHTMRRFLGKYRMQEVLRKTPSDPDVRICRNAVILSTDIRNYSRLSEYGRAGEIVNYNVVNPIFRFMNEELEQAGGTILGFVGDCIVVVFNTFEEQQSDISDILNRLIRCLHHIRTFSRLSQLTGLPEIRIGVGISKGTAAIGYIGGLERCDLTVLGNTINLAARIESKTKELPGDILVSQACFDDNEPDIWKNPLNISYTLRDVGFHAMKNIRKPVHLYSLSPLLRYGVDFVPMGFVAAPEKGAVYLDTGNAGEPGIIDHHFQGSDAESACELLLQKPELLLGHVHSVPRSEIEFRVHTKPDMDCAATLYAACELLDKNPRTDILKKLAGYVSLVDQAKIPMPERMSDSLYGIFRAHEAVAQNKKGSTLSDLELLEAQLRVIDAAVYLMGKIRLGGDFAYIFQFAPEWFEAEKHLIETDWKQYKEDIRLGHTYSAPIRGVGEVVTGLWLDHPKSIFFRIWAWSDPSAPGGKGYKFLALDMSDPGKNRFVIGVDPASGNTLNGLGEFLEKHESDKRRQTGRERPVYPIRHPSDNSDPWYFGQGHGFAVIDSPGEGTVLTAEEVQDIHRKWRMGKNADGE